MPMYLDQLSPCECKREVKTVEMGLNLLDVPNNKSLATVGPCKAVAIGYWQHTQSWDQTMWII